MTEPTRDELLEALRMVEDYVRHRKSCPFGMGMGTREYCTCGVGDVVDHVDDLLTDTDKEMNTEQ